MNLSPHICHITTAHPLLDTRIFRRECVSLAKAGFRVTLIAVHDKEEMIDGVQIVPLPKPSNKLSRRLLLTKTASRLAMELSADLYHFHDPELLSVMRKVARKTDVPVIWDAHEDFVTSIEYFNQFILPPVSKLGAKYFSRMELQACLKDFAGMITVTEPIAERYRQAGIPTCLVENYVDLESLPYPPEVARSEIPRFSSSGVQNRERLVPEIAQAFQKVRQEFPCEVAFWGNFSSEELRNEVQETALQGKANADDLIISNQIPWKTLMQERIPTAWMSCVLMNLSNRNNKVGLPNRCFENWANGVPTLATEGSEVARITYETGAGLVVQNNCAEEIADAFRMIAQDPDRVKEMGQAGRKAIETRFNWNEAFKRMIDFYAKFGICMKEESKPVSTIQQNTELSLEESSSIPSPKPS